MNLPANVNQFQIRRRENPSAMRNFRIGWGVKTEGIKEGDYIEGIILGFETNDYGAKNIILKSFMHNGQKVTVFGCSTLQRELHSDPNFNQLIWNPGDVIRITYVKSYIAQKGKGAGKSIAVFNIDELIGYQMTQTDVYEIEGFIAEQLQKKPLAAYKPPMQQFAPPPYGQQVQQVYAQQAYATPVVPATPASYQQGYQQAPIVNQYSPQAEAPKPFQQVYQKPSEEDFDI